MKDIDMYIIIYASMELLFFHVKRVPDAALALPENIHIIIQHEKIQTLLR
jgi:hypothetical protein